jgi:hypothetical protein
MTPIRAAPLIVGTVRGGGAGAHGQRYMAQKKEKAS